MFHPHHPSSFCERHFLPLYLAGLAVIAVYAYFLIESILTW
jgi:hypothetical protein